MINSAFFADGIAETALTIRRLDPNSAEDSALVREGVFDSIADEYDNVYPGVRDWFNRKVIPGFRNGTRIVHIVQRPASNVIVGLSIAKISDKPQNKLCTFLVLPEARSTGIGARLMGVTLKCLWIVSGPKPVVITVPEDRATERTDKKSLVEFLQAFGFKQIDAIPDRYLPGKTEFIFRRDPKGENEFL